LHFFPRQKPPPLTSAFCVSLTTRPLGHVSSSDRTCMCSPRFLLTAFSPHSRPLWRSVPDRDSGSLPPIFPAWTFHLRNFFFLVFPLANSSPEEGAAAVYSPLDYSHHGPVVPPRDLCSCAWQILFARRITRFFLSPPGNGFSFLGFSIGLGASRFSPPFFGHDSSVLEPNVGLALYGVFFPPPPP